MLATGFEFFKQKMKLKISAFLSFMMLLSGGYAQDIKIKNIVFEGAGMRGLAYGGVVSSLEQHGIIDDIEKVGGTSAGAIIALLISLDYNSEELTSIIYNTKFRKFNDGKFIFIGGISRTMKRYGWYRGEKFSEWLGNLIEEKTGNPEITFEQLHERGYKDLYLTATCLNRQQLVILSRKTYPNMKIKDAVRVSMSVPLYYQAVFVDRAGNIFSKPVDGKKLDVMVDGGIIGNFPIQIFDRVINDSLSQQVRIPNYETLGVRIDSDLQIQQDSTSRKLAEYPIEDFQDYIQAFYVMVIENLNRQHLTKMDWDRTISISSVGVGPKVKKLSKDQKERLISSGIQSTDKYLKTYQKRLTEK